MGATAAHDPLHDPERDARARTPALDIAIDLARQALDKHAGANIHSHDEMLAAATGLDYVLRSLLAALPAKEDQ
ncbi:hypothetical protein OG911_28080 [Streptomyces sp. NBC_00208]|uniref:hypothetical protein n=1 Tax=Streptomyces sp. NBC_00208 TaxID=2975681 RepID=UPI002E2B77B5|nr:hypothetical protein [Streptomyces sp. NBC_00208]